MQSYRKMPGFTSLIITLLVILLTLKCFPQECPECFSEDSITYEFDYISIPQLASNQIKSLKTDSAGQNLLLATNGGGVAKLDSNLTATIRTTPNLTSNYCAGFAASLLQEMMICLDSSTNPVTAIAHGHDDINGYYTPFTSTTGRFTDLIFNGSNFYIIEDLRSENILSKSAAAQSRLYLFLDANDGSPLTMDVNNTNFPESTISTVTGQAINRIHYDKDGDVLGAGYGWVNNQTDIRLTLYRLKKDILTLKDPTSSNPIKPINFGLARETPLALTYHNRSVSNYIEEKVFVATDGGLYEILLQNYRIIFEIKRHYFDGSSWSQGNSPSSLEIRDLLFYNSSLYIASNQGIHILRDDFEVLNSANSDLPDNDITALTAFNGHVFAATTAGLIKITEIQKN